MGIAAAKKVILESTGVGWALPTKRSERLSPRFFPIRLPQARSLGIVRQAFRLSLVIGAPLRPVGVFGRL